MKIAIIGSRSFQSGKLVFEYVQLQNIRDVIVTGGASGVDIWAEEAARSRRMSRIVFEPMPDERGQLVASCFLRRNKLIAEECDRMVAFWDGLSRGTKHACLEASKRGKRVTVFDEFGSEIQM